MRKRLIAAALALAIALTLGCEEKESGKSSGGNVKLLESITDGDGKVLQKFEYDDKNRLIKIYRYEDKNISSTKTITYSSDNLVTVEEAGSYENVTKYVKKGNTITVENKRNPDTLTIDKDGYIVKDSYYNYEYENGNLTRKSKESKDSDGTRNVESISCTYDNKKSPFFNSNTPKWLFIWIFVDSYGVKNNILASYHGYVVFKPGNLDGEGDSSSEEFEYEYDSEGFAIKQTVREFLIGETEDDPVPKVNHFIYRGKGGAK